MFVINLKLNKNYVSILKEAYRDSIQELDKVKKFFNEIKNIDTEKYSVIIYKDRVLIKHNLKNFLIMPYHFFICVIKI